MDLNSKKTFIISEVDNLDFDDKIHILDVLRQQIPPKSIKEHADGCRINLDKLTDDIINKIHYIILTKIKAHKSNFISV